MQTIKNKYYAKKYERKRKTIIIDETLLNVIFIIISKAIKDCNLYAFISVQKKFTFVTKSFLLIQ